MAGNSLGGLIVTLALDAAEFITGLTKAEREAQKFAEDARRSANVARTSYAELGRFIAGLGLGAAFVAATKEIISNAESLNNLSAATGSSVESLSKLANQARISGTSFESLQTIVGKFAARLGGGGKDANEFARAMAYLGVTAKDPVEALNQAAVKLNQFSDGAGKAAILVAMLGKGGEQYASTLKDIGEAQDIAATTTTKQAEEAEKLGKAFRQLSVDAVDFRNAILNDMVPALNDLLRTFADARKEGGGFFAGLGLLSSTMSFGLQTSEEGIARVRKEIEGLERAIAAPAGVITKLFGNEKAQVDQYQRSLEKARKTLALLQDSQLREFGGPPTNAQAVKPQVGFRGKDDDARAIKERTSETERYIDSLEKQLQATLELTAEETVAVAIYDLRHKQLKEVTAAEEAYALAIGRQLDASKEAKKVADELRRAEEEAARARERNARELERFIEGARRERQSIDDSNRATADQIVFLTEGADGLKRLTDARLDSTISAAEHVAAMKREAGAGADVIAELDGIVDALKLKKQLAGQLSIAENFAAEKRAAEEFGNAMADSFGNAFEGFILGTKSAKDAFKDFALDVERYLVRLALQNLGKSIFGGSAGGPDIFSLMAKFIGAYAGGGAGGIGYAPGVEAMGPPAFAVGTNYVPRDMLVMAHRGERITPAAQNRGAQRAGNVYNINIPVNVLPGATTASVRQTKAMVRDAVVSATRER